MKNHIFIQARVCSKRLPGKVLKRICNKSIIEIIQERLKKINEVDGIFLVTGIREKNVQLIEEARRLGLDYLCGSEENILDRFYKASQEFNSDNIVRVTADCPLIDFNVIKEGFRVYNEGNYDILSNVRIRTYPHGFDFEIFKKDALRISWIDNLDRYPNEKVFYNTFIPPTKYILAEKKFKNYDLINDVNLAHIRLTLDYPEDLEVITKIYESLYVKNKCFTLKEILNLFQNRPALTKINEKYLESK